MCGRGRGLARRWTARPGRRRSRPGARSKRRCASLRGGMAGGRARSSRRCAGCIGGTAPASRRASSRASKVCSSPRGRTSGRCRGGNWSEVARRCGCSVRTAQGASERLARLKHWENGRLSAGQYVQRASLIRVPDFQISSTSKVCTPPAGRLRARGWRAESAAAVSSSPGTFGWAGYGRAGRRERARAAGPPAALSVHARLRRIGFVLLCRYPGLRARLRVGRRTGTPARLWPVAEPGRCLSRAEIASAPGQCQRLRRPPLRCGPFG